MSVLVVTWLTCALPAQTHDSDASRLTGRVGGRVGVAAFPSHRAQTFLALAYEAGIGLFLTPNLSLELVGSDGVMSGESSGGEPSTIFGLGPRLTRWFGTAVALEAGVEINAYAGRYPGCAFCFDEYDFRTAGTVIAGTRFPISTRIPVTIGLEYRHNWLSTPADPTWPAGSGNSVFLTLGFQIIGRRNIYYEVPGRQRRDSEQSEQRMPGWSRY